MATDPQPSQKSERDERLRKIVDYCAGMLAAVDAGEQGAPDFPGVVEVLEDIQRMAEGGADARG